MLSFKKGRTIAKIKGGEYNDKTLYIDSSDIDLKKKKKKMLLKKMKRHQKNKKDESSCSSKDTSSESEEEKKMEEIELDDGVLVPFPKKGQRECLYISAPSGSGKSTYTANYIKSFKKTFPGAPIFLFSRVDSDEVLDSISGIQRIMLNEELIQDPVKPAELRNSLVIFDDTDTIPQKSLRSAIIDLKNDILEVGRHYNIYIIITSHLISNYSETRTVLNECTSLTIFPRSGAAHQIKYCLKNYFGLDTEQVNRVLKLPSRWVTIFKNYPITVMYESGAYLL